MDLKFILNPTQKQNPTLFFSWFFFFIVEKYNHDTKKFKILKTNLENKKKNIYQR